METADRVASTNDPVRIEVDQIEARVKDLTTRLIEGAEQRQIRVRTPRPWVERAGLISIELGRPASATVASLKKKGVIVSEKDGFLRAGIHFYNNEEDIERLLHGISGL